jgi:hypothetical protein
MSKFQKEIDEAIEQLAKDNRCSKENLEYVVINRENGFCLITQDAFNKLNASKKNKLIRRDRKKRAKTA